MLRHKAIPCSGASQDVSTCRAPSWPLSMAGRCSFDRLVPRPLLIRRDLCHARYTTEIRDSQRPRKLGKQTVCSTQSNLLNYGKGPTRLASELKIPQKITEKVTERVLSQNPRASQESIEKAIMWAAKDEAQEIIDRYFSKIPGVRDFINTTHQRVADTKYVESVLGRRRWLRQVMDLDNQRNHQLRAQNEGKSACWCGDCAASRAGDRQSVNTIIQSSAADVTQAAMIKCYYDPQLSNTRMLFQVHDEVCFEVPEDELDEAMARIKFNMENPGITLKVPLKASPGAGNNWIEAK